jgi:hypothetical protein
MARKKAKSGGKARKKLTVRKRVVKDLDGLKGGGVQGGRIGGDQFTKAR